MTFAFLARPPEELAFQPQGVASPASSLTNNTVNSDVEPEPPENLSFSLHAKARKDNKIIIKITCFLIFLPFYFGFF